MVVTIWCYREFDIPEKKYRLNGYLTKPRLQDGWRHFYPQYDFHKFPHLKHSISHVEWTEFCEIDQMKKMNVSQFFFFQVVPFYSAASKE